MNKKFFGLIFVLSFIFVNGFTNIASAAEAKIINFFPISGKVGDTVTITGENFSGIDGVLFGSIDVGLNFTAVSPTKIITKVPADAIGGKITVKTIPYGNIVSTNTFTVTGIPKITSFSVTSSISGSTIGSTTGAVGDTITIIGENFIGVSWVFFGTGSNVTITNTPTEITVRIPPDATNGKITVHTANGDAISSNNFTVTGNSAISNTTITNNESKTISDDPLCANISKKVEFKGLVPICNTVVDSKGGYCDPCDFNSLLGGVNKFISFVLITLATPLFALILIYVGWLYLSAGGSSENVTKAKKILKNALIGYIIALAAWLIVKTILTALGFTGPMFLG